MTETIPRVAVPKPSRVVSWVRSRTNPPQIAEHEAIEVLEHYGLRLLKKPSNLSMSWRNEIVVVATSSGRKVLKRYRETSNLETITHEHSIIDCLNEQRFPSTRLAHSTSGDSVVELGGGLYALFDFESGRQFSSMLLSAGQRQLLLGAAGATMARFHSSLEGFQPAGRHHLGFDPRSGERRRDASWYLDALDRLSGPQDEPAGAAGVLTRWLSERAGYIRDALGETTAAVSGAALPTTVIHGDFGIHNLLFRRDGTPVVYDYELSRFDWRLADIVIGLIRVLPANQPAFVAGYRRFGDLPADELELLPDMWRFHLLTGAVRSWHGFSEMGGLDRLETARARVASVQSGLDVLSGSWP